METIVTVYTKQMCVHCMKAKDWLIQHKVSYNEIDVNTMGDNEVKKNIKGVPYIIISGGKHEEVILGFNKEKLSNLLLNRSSET